MPTAQTREAFLALVERSGLLAPERLDSYRTTDSAPDLVAAVELARTLVRDRLLTPFQARQLLRGKSRGYFLSEKYKVLEQLGEGGMGQVVLAEHLLLQKLVAVKLLNASWVTVPGAEERFLREARAAAAVDHPNIVRVFDVDRAAGVPFMVMEYVDGVNLHQLVAEHGPLSPLRAAEYTRQAAVGLHAAHRVGLVHRDIKPGNILLDRAGVVKVLDLGLARFLVDSKRNNSLTERFDPGTVLGTLDFIAPEQADNSSTVDIRADVYSLGYTLYYLLTGKLPFGEGSAAQKLMWHQAREPEPLTTLRPDLPAAFQLVFERMTRKNPLERYATPAEVVAALRPLVSAPVAPPPPEQMPKLRPAMFQLGLAPPPTAEVIAKVAPEPSTPPTSVAETTRLAKGSTQDESDSDVLRAVTNRAGVNDSDPLAVTPAGARSKPMQSRSRWPLFAGIAAVCAIGIGLAAWFLNGPREKSADNPPANSAPANPPVLSTGVVLTGEGSSFVDPMMQRWADVYQKKAGVTIKYAKTGSSAGVREFTSKRVMFGATDAFIEDRRLPDIEGAGGSPVLHVPLVMGAVVATYNLPSLVEPLKFPGGVLADIYLGKITKWNHPTIVNNNPGVKLPDRDIKVVHRKEGSGTTYIWTDYLCKVSGEWEAGPGRGTAVRWPTGVSAEGNAGVAQEVKAVVGAIGYVELGYAMAENLSVASVRHKTNFIAPSLESVTAAAASKLKEPVNVKKEEGIPPDLRFTLTAAPGEKSYPICGTTWAVVFKHQLSDNKELADFLRWVVHDGQNYVAELKYAPLPPELVQRVEAILANP